MPKRTSMKGMGVDAFFRSSSSQHTGMPSDQQDSSTASQQAVKLVKATFYLTPEQLLFLERVRLTRKERGEKVDKSALVREAIDRLQA